MTAAGTAAIVGEGTAIAEADAAFGKITTSFVEDVVMPPLAMITGKVNFQDLKIVLGTGSDGKEMAMRYGNFLSVILQFLIITFFVFLMVKAINKAKARFNEPVPQDTPPSVKTCPYCLSEVDIAAKRCKYCTSDL